MKNRTLLWLVAALVFSLSSTASLHAESTSIKATLILGSNEGESIHPQLKPFEKNLKRIFKYSSYELRGQGSTHIELPNTGEISLNQSHSLKLDASQAANGKIRLKVDWSDRNRNLINTTLVVQKGQPTVLGGPPLKGHSGNLILVIVPR